MLKAEHGLVLWFANTVKTGVMPKTLNVQGKHNNSTHVSKTARTVYQLDWDSLVFCFSSQYQGLNPGLWLSSKSLVLYKFLKFGDRISLSCPTGTWTSDLLGQAPAVLGWRVYRHTQQLSFNIRPTLPRSCLAISLIQSKYCEKTNMEQAVIRPSPICPQDLRSCATSAHHP